MKPAPTTSIGGVTLYSAINIRPDPYARKVILRKVSGDTSTKYTSLKGAEFTVYYADKQTVVKVGDQKLKDLVSGENGVFWIGTLPFGTYYMEEKKVAEGYKEPTHYFVFTVSETGVTEPRTGPEEPKITKELAESAKDEDKVPSKD